MKKTSTSNDTGCSASLTNGALDDREVSARWDAVAKIAAAFAARETSTVDEVLSLTTQLSQLMASVALPDTSDKVIDSQPIAAGSDVKAIPIMPPQKAVTRDKVYCLVCGRGFAMLKRHLKAEHDLTEEQYREMYGLADDYPLVAPEYSERKARYAKEIGLGKHNRAAPAKAGTLST